MDNNELMKFQRSLLENGIVGYSQSDLKYLFNVAKSCAVIAGLPMAAGIGAKMAGAGAVTVPGIGAIPGALAGALAGFVGGTAACTIARTSLKRGLDDILLKKQ